jgi:hypothetical protein
MSEIRTIGPTPERLAKAGDAVEVYTPDQSENWRAIRLSDESPLEYLQGRGVITGDQYSAGMRYYGDWYMAGLANSGVMDPGRVIVDGGQVEHWSDRKLDAMTRYNRALKALGPALGPVLSDLLTNAKPEKLEDYGRRKCGQRNFKLARLAAINRMQLALDALDYHYHGERQRRAHVSHVDDYRPTILNHPPEE